MENIESQVNAGQEQVVDAQISEVSEQPVQSVTEEVANPQQEKPVQSKEENAKFAEVRRRAEAEARDKTIADMGMVWNGKPITTYDQYVKAKAEAEEEQRRQSLQDRGIDPNVVDEYVNSNPTVKKAKELLEQQEAQQKKNNEYMEFLEYFRNENDREFNVSTDVIPPEVWELNAKGKSLADAFAYHTNKQLKAKLAEYEAKMKAQETNAKNAASSPGSVTGNGKADDGFISKETFDSNKNDQRWVMKNLSKISESRLKW